MITYGLGNPPLIRDLRTDHPGVNQTWDAGDAGAGSTFSVILQNLDRLMARGPLGGYLPEPTKSILVMSPRKVPQAEALFRGYSLKVVTGSRYLGGSMWTEVAHDRWLA